jgi:hypothetical protein
VGRTSWFLAVVVAMVLILERERERVALLLEFQSYYDMIDPSSQTPNGVDDVG